MKKIDKPDWKGKFPMIANAIDEIIDTLNGVIDEVNTNEKAIAELKKHTHVTKMGNMESYTSEQPLGTDNSVEGMRDNSLDAYVEGRMDSDGQGSWVCSECGKDWGDGNKLWAGACRRREPVESWIERLKAALDAVIEERDEAYDEIDKLKAENEKLDKELDDQIAMVEDLITESSICQRNFEKAQETINRVRELAEAYNKAVPSYKWHAILGAIKENE